MTDEEIAAKISAVRYSKTADYKALAKELIEIVKQLQRERDTARDDAKEARNLIQVYIDVAKQQRADLKVED